MLVHQNIGSDFLLLEDSADILRVWLSGYILQHLQYRLYIHPNSGDLVTRRRLTFLAVKVKDIIHTHLVHQNIGSHFDAYMSNIDPNSHVSVSSSSPPASNVVFAPSI